MGLGTILGALLAYGAITAWEDHKESRKTRKKPTLTEYKTHHKDGRPMTQEERWEANAK